MIAHSYEQKVLVRDGLVEGDDVQTRFLLPEKFFFGHRYSLEQGHPILDFFCESEEGVRRELGIYRDALGFKDLGDVDVNDDKIDALIYHGRQFNANKSGIVTYSKEILDRIPEGLPR
ncbi:hypothetical protein CMI38_03200 [Candidatus Pacearchaeota archaeon]|jgi:hypothetical protein|nr:hypothetical protein [Candidatus Pacearchaeota archaeon]|tara:strand:- start:6055 stop:6408 length:354 start_codon:yes stop_codon:yes gene_type:complete